MYMEAKKSVNALWTFNTLRLVSQGCSNRGPGECRDSSEVEEGGHPLEGTTPKATLGSQQSGNRTRQLWIPACPGNSELHMPSGCKSKAELIFNRRKRQFRVAWGY